MTAFVLCLNTELSLLQLLSIVIAVFGMIAISHIAEKVGSDIRVLICLQYDYGQLLGRSQDFYRSQWVGNLAGKDVPSWRGSAFTAEVGPTIGKLDWGDITGGVMEGGDAGRQAQLLKLRKALPTSTCALVHVADVVCFVMVQSAWWDGCCCSVIVCVHDIASIFLTDSPTDRTPRTATATKSIGTLQHHQAELLLQHAVTICNSVWQHPART